MIAGTDGPLSEPDQRPRPSLRDGRIAKSGQTAPHGALPDDMVAAAHYGWPMSLRVRVLGLVCISVFGACSSGHSKTVSSATVGATFTAVGASVNGSGTAPASKTAGGSVTAGGASTAGTVKAVVRDACSLLTTAELESALGGTVAGGSLTTAPGSNETICEWTITPNSGDGFGVELRTSPGSVADFNQRRQAASGPTGDVAGVGDQAYSERYVNGSLVFDDLWVRKGAESFRVEVLKDMGSKPLVQLAQAVITRL